jgi:parallel beta-helix repeat protein
MSSCDRVINVQDLPGAEQVSGADQIIVQRNDQTSILDVSNFILGLDNTTFGDTVGQMLVDSDTAIKTSIQVHDTLDDLSKITGQSEQVVFVKRINSASDIDTGGFFIYNSSSSQDPVDGVIVNSDPGQWIRTQFDYVNAKWFGISTSTANNSPGLQNAINYAASIRKPLYIPKFNESIRITEPITLGIDSNIISNGATVHTNAACMFKIDNVNAVSIHNLHIIGPASLGNADNCTTGLIDIRDSQYIKITNCSIKYSNCTGILINGSKHCTVLNNTIEHNNSYGVHLTSTEGNTCMFNIVSQNIINVNDGASKTKSIGIYENTGEVSPPQVGYNNIIGNVGVDNVESTVTNNSSVVTTLGETRNESYGGV